MKLYDKAYTEAPSKKETDYYMDKMGDNFPLKEHTDVIMLSIEELKEMWFKAQNFGRDISNYHSSVSPSHNGYVDFQSFMQSKGLTIKQQ